MTTTTTTNKNKAHEEARRKAYEAAMEKLNGNQKWSLPAHTEGDEWGFPVNSGNGSLMYPETNRPGDQS